MTNAAKVEHIPRDAFETMLFRRELERQFAWQHDGLPLRVGIGQQADSAGRFTVTIMAEPQTFDIRRYAQDNQGVTGVCWLTENAHGEPVGWWSLPVQPMVAAEQTNDSRHTPLVAWS